MPETTATQPTPAMLKWFLRANHLDQIKYGGTRGFGRSSWERCMKRAEAEGYVTPNPYGEYELTDLGRAARDAAKAKNEPTASPGP